MPLPALGAAAAARFIARYGAKAYRAYRASEAVKQAAKPKAKARPKPKTKQKAKIARKIKRTIGALGDDQEHGKATTKSNKTVTVKLAKTPKKKPTQKKAARKGGKSIKPSGGYKRHSRKQLSSTPKSYRKYKKYR